MNYKKILKAISVIIVIAILFSCIIYFVTPPSIYKAELCLFKDRNLLYAVVEYLESYDGDFYIHKYDTYDLNKMEDETTKKAINKLFKRKYAAIGKSGDTIYFLKWTSGKDLGSGIAYSMISDQDPQIQFSKKIIHLSKKQWYYYEAN